MTFHFHRLELLKNYMAFVIEAKQHNRENIRRTIDWVSGAGVLVHFEHIIIPSFEEYCNDQSLIDNSISLCTSTS